MSRRQGVATGVANTSGVSTMRTSLSALAIAILMAISILLLCSPTNMGQMMDTPLPAGGAPCAGSSVPEDGFLSGYGGSEVLVAIIVALTIAEMLRKARRGT